MAALKVDVAVLGGGPAGYTAALRAARLGGTVALVEDREVGGVCLNRGCIPTKALMQTAATVSALGRAAELGIDARLEGISWDTALRRKDRIVKNLRTGVEQLLAAAGVQMVWGRGTVEAPGELAVITDDGPVIINWDRLILATGARPALPRIPGIDGEARTGGRILTSDGLLSIEALPESLVILGGGVIGLECAAMVAPLGVKVTVLEARDQVLPGEDPEAAALIGKSLKRQGVRIKTGATVMELEPEEAGLAVRYNHKGKAAVVKGEKVLLAVGRAANTDAFAALNLTIKDGTVVTDDHQATSLPGVYAAGDITGCPLLAHKAYMEGRVAAENAMGLESRREAVIPACVYTQPELASVGLSEAQARTAGITPQTGRFDLRHNGRAQTLGEREGLAQVVADEGGTVIGARIVGPHASEMISELTLAIRQGVPAEAIARMVHPHPTLSEAIWEAAGAIDGCGIHGMG